MQSRLLSSAFNDRCIRAHVDVRCVKARRRPHHFCGDGEEELNQKCSEKFVLQERSQPRRTGGEGGGETREREEEVQILEVQDEVEERLSSRAVS